MKKRYLPFLFLCAVLVVLCFYAWALQYNTERIEHTAILRLVGCSVWDYHFSSVPITRIDWGVLEPSETAFRSVLIKNEGCDPVTLSIYAENWVPVSVDAWIHFSTDYSNNSVIAPLTAFPVTLILGVSADVHGVTSFSFDIVVSAIWG